MYAKAKNKKNYFVVATNHFRVEAVKDHESVGVISRDSGFNPPKQVVLKRALLGEAFLY